MRSIAYLSRVILMVSVLSFLLVACGPGVDPAFTFSPAPGTFAEAVEVSIEFSDPRSRIFLTVDGTTPDETSIPYYPGETVLTVRSDVPLNVAAYRNGVEQATGTGEYLIETGAVLESVVYGEYTNTTGLNPTFTIDSETRPPEFDSDPATATADASDATININNISIFSNEMSYYLQSILVEEERSGNWMPDSETTTTFSNLTDVAVVLVLDCSDSLGGQFTTVKNLAKQAITDGLAASQDIQFGIVSFNASVSSYGPSSNESLLHSHVDSLSQAGYTAYYDALREAITMLDGLTDVEGKAIVSFTDGLDNYSVPATYDDIVTDMETKSIKSITIGLQGNDALDEVALAALGRTSYISSANIEEFSAEFLFAVEGVTNVYTASYERSPQPVTSLPMRFTFTSTLDSSGVIPEGGVSVEQPGVAEYFTTGDGWDAEFPWSVDNYELELNSNTYGGYEEYTATSPTYYIPYDSELSLSVSGQVSTDYGQGFTVGINADDGRDVLWTMPYNHDATDITVDLEDYGGQDATIDFTFSAGEWWSWADIQVDNLVISKRE